MWKLAKISNEVNKVGKIFIDFSRENRQQMQNGTWKMRYRGKLLWVNNQRSSLACIELIESNSHHHPSKKESIKRFIKEALGIRFKYRVLNENIVSGSNIDCIMYSATGDMYFFYWSEKIIKKEISRKKMKQFELLTEEKYWDIFNSPVVSINENYTIEKIIRSQVKTNDERSKYIYILTGYYQYLSNASAVDKVKVSALLANYYVELPEIEKIFCDEILELDINVYYMHGDMWSENVLQDEEKYYVIDYDHVGLYPFFFDVLEYIWAPYINEGVLLFWKELNDANEDISKIFDKLFFMQGLKTNYQTKFAIMILMGMMRFHIYNQRFLRSDGYENKNYKKNHYDFLVKFIYKYMEYGKTI